METSPSIWKNCLKYGLIMALVSIVITMIFYMLDLMFATWAIIPIIITSIIVLFLLQRSYRDTYENGYITYGRALGSGVIMFIYAAIIIAIFYYILYAFIDPGLSEKSLAVTAAKLEAKGMPESAMDAALKVQEKMYKPWVVGLTSIFGTIFQGVLISLFTSIFVVKKGNPLLEE